MTRLILTVFAVLLWAIPASAQQEVDASRIYLGVPGNTLTFRTGSGSPEGVVTSPVNGQYYDYTTGEKWRKASGSGNTGWIKEAGTVTSVALTFPTGLSGSGCTITTSGTCAISLTSGYMIPGGGNAGDWLKSNGASAPSFAAPAALTKVDDTNVTLTLGGSATTALLNAASITAGWTGTLAVARGGTGAGTWATNGVLYGQGTSALAITAQGGTNSVLTANGGAPSFSTNPTVTTVTTTADAAVGDDLTVADSVTTATLFPRVLNNGVTFRQCLSNLTRYCLDMRTGLDGTGWLTSFDTSGGVWMPLVAKASALTFDAPTTTTGAATFSDRVIAGGRVGTADYVSETTGWQANTDGSADFQYLTAREMRVKVFTAVLEQALSGAQIISKSNAVLSSAFTCPSLGGISTLSVEDIPGAANMNVFESGDSVVIQNYSRASGTLTVGTCVGVVTSVSTAPDGYQTWTFTRGATAGTGGSVATDTVIEAGTLAMDYGTAGNGVIESTAVDGAYGANSPYVQIKTWTGAPTSSNFTVRTRFGNLEGITGVDGEYGLIAGIYAATGGQYLRASNSAFELHGISLKLWNSTTEVMRLDPSALSFAMGTSVPTSYTSGVGCWQGLHAGVFKWRCGDPAGGTQYIDWNGTQLTIAGNIVVTGTSIDAATVVGVAGATVVAGAALGNLGITAQGNPALPAAAVPSGSGLFLGSDKMGYYASSAWQTYMDNSGNFYLGGASGSLQYTSGVLSITDGLTGGWDIGASYIRDAAGAVGLSSAVTGGNDCRIWAGDTTCTSGPFRVYEDGSFVASNATITGSITVTGGNAATTTYVDTAESDAISSATATAASDATTKANAAAAASLDKATYLTPATTTIAGGTITTGTITANKLNVTDLSAISANLGTITAGSVTLGSNGYVRQGQTAYETGTGFWIGDVAGTPKLSIGSSSTFLKWTGSALALDTGPVVVDGDGIQVSPSVDTPGADGCYRFSSGTGWAMCGHQNDGPITTTISVINSGNTGAFDIATLALYAGKTHASATATITLTADTSVTTTAPAISLVGATSITGALAVSSTVTGGTYNGQTISSAASFSGTLAVASTVTGGTYNGQTISSAASFTGTLLAVGAIRSNAGFNINGTSGLTRTCNPTAGSMEFTGGILTNCTAVDPADPLAAVRPLVDPVWSELSALRAEVARLSALVGGRR